MISRSDTVDAYDLYHEVYDAEIVDFWQKFPSTIVDAFVSNLKGRSVLNLGSGTGRDSLLLRDRGLEVTCLDGSPNMVKHTRELGFLSTLGDIRKLTFPDDSFDGVWAYSSLIHVPYEDMKDILSQINRILRKDSLLLLGLIKGNGSENISIGGSEYTRYFEYYDPGKLKSALGDLRYEEVYSQEYKPGNQVYLNYVLRKHH